MKNDLVFLGKVRDFDGKALTVVNTAGVQVPPVIYNSEWKIFIRTALQGRKLHTTVVSGLICGSSRYLWKLDKLTRFKFDEQRSSFRQKVDAPATALCVNSIYRPGELHGNEAVKAKAKEAAVPCRVVDISLGGLQMYCSERYSSGDYVLVSDAFLLPNEDAFAFTCQIRWADRANPREFYFGCHFTNPTEAEQDRLCHVMFELQRMDIKNHRKEG